MKRKKEGKKKDKKQTKEDKKGSLKRGESKKARGLLFWGKGARYLSLFLQLPSKMKPIFRTLNKKEPRLLIHDV
jgi:hypothetical protein